MFADFLNSLPLSIKWRMVWYLVFLLALSAWGVHNPSLFLRGLFIVVMYAGVDVAWTLVRDRKTYVPVSSIISGLIISLVLAPTTPFLLVAAVPLVAVFSKQVLRFGFSRHVFNPAVFSLMCASLVFAPAASWWGVSWGIVPLCLVAVAGFVIVTGQKRWHEALPFMAVYVALTGLMLGIHGVSGGDLIVVRRVALDGTLLFFTSVMLIEPMTSQFPSFSKRVLYAAGTACAAVVLGRVSFGSMRVDPLLGGLLASNLFSSLAFLKRSRNAK